MRKIFLFLSILLVLGVVTNSCISEKVTEDILPDPGPEPEPNPNEKKLFQVQTTIELTSFYKRNSMNNDVIGLFMYNNNNIVQDNIPVTLSATGSAEIELSTNYVNAYCFGYYPRSQSAVSAGTSIYVGELSAEQDQNVTTSPNVADVPETLANQLLMVSSQSSYVNFNSQIAARNQFKNSFSLLRFHISKNESIAGFGNQYLKKAEIYVSNATDTLTPLTTHKLAGAYSIDLKEVAYTGDIAPVFSSSYASKITANILNKRDVSNTPLIVWYVIPPLAILDDKLVLRLEMEDEHEGKSYSTHTFTFGDRNIIGRNELIERSVVLNKDNFYSEDMVKEENNFVDAPANSYIISKPDMYQISAEKVLKTGGYQIPEGKTVDWLWASKEDGDPDFDIEDLIYPSSIKYNKEDKTIRFRVGNAKGNVVLALKDDDDNVLWTWHIWLTDKKDVRIGTKDFLDRNLGALSTERTTSSVFDNTYGFVYQWGRKDPFFGGNGLSPEGLLSDAESYVKRNTNGVWKGANVWSVSTQPGFIDDAIEFPMQFISSTKSGTLGGDMKNPADWLSSNNNNLWQDGAKTEYDPCPYGYKVPNRNDFNAIRDAYNSYKTFLDTEISSLWYFRSAGNKYWEYIYNNGPVTILPAAGKRQGRDNSDQTGAQLNYSGTNGESGSCFYWTSTPVVDLFEVAQGGSYRLRTNGIVLYENDEFGDKADAYPVRCVKYTP